MFAEIPNRFKEVIVIGKIMILKFLDTEEQIMDQVRSIIRNENNVEYTEIMPKSVLYFKDLKIQLNRNFLSLGITLLFHIHKGIIGCRQALDFLAFRYFL